MASTTGAPLDQALTAMLDVLGGYLPPLALPLPGASISVASVRERAIGIGYQRGIDVRGAFAVADLKGLRLDAVVRFQLWAANPGQLDTALNGLNTRLLADRNILWTAGVLRMALDATAVTEFVSSVDGWRGLADYRVLFEYHYSDSDGAESLIARIPIEADQEILNSPDRETSLVTDEMARWDDQSAPALVLRGRLRIGSLSALAFVPGAAPSGAVTITRTYDGATGAPSLHGTLAEFLAALGNPAGPERNAQVSFATLSDFLAALGAGTPDIVLGDWNLDGVLDSYELKVLPFDPPIQLPSVSDRLEIRYANAPFDQVAVVYLRAQRR